MTDSDGYGSVGAEGPGAAGGILASPISTEPGAIASVAELSADADRIAADRIAVRPTAVDLSSDLDPIAADSESKPGRMPLALSVLLADVGIAVVALVLLVVIGLQRWDDTSLSAQHRAYGESLFLIFSVAALFGVVGVLLIRAKHMRVAVMQFAVVAAVVVLGIVVAANGDPKPDTSDNQAAASFSTMR